MSKSGVYYVLKKYRQSGILYDYPRSGRPTALGSQTHDCINLWLSINNELTINDILLKLNAMGINVSKSALGRAIQRIG